jgi:MoaA/NifB/PqqE/SkfB family radical SAM enzyme
MSLDTYEKISKSFPYVENVYLSGWGEPLLNPNFLNMIRLAKEEGCSVGFTTNMEKFDEHTMRNLVEFDTDLVGISIAGFSDKAHNSIRKGSNLRLVLKNISKLNDIKDETGSKNPKILLYYMMLKNNIVELPKIIELAAELKVDGIIATNLDYVGVQIQDRMKTFSCETPENNMIENVYRAKEVAKKLRVNFRVFSLEKGKAERCSEDPINNLYVSENGDVYPCVYLGLPVTNIPRIFCGKKINISHNGFGNINQKNIKEIWKDEKYIDFRRRHENMIHKQDSNKNLFPEVCKTCYKIYGI